MLFLVYGWVVCSVCVILFCRFLELMVDGGFIVEIVSICSR